MSKHVLKIEPVEVHLNEKCYGVVALKRPPQIAWLLSQRLGIEWVCEPPRFYHPEVADCPMELFAAYASHPRPGLWRLLSNRLLSSNGEKYPFIKEWNFFDYLLLLHPEEENPNLALELRKSSSIIHVQRLDPNQPKDKLWLIP